MVSDVPSRLRTHVEACSGLLAKGLVTSKETNNIIKALQRRHSPAVHRAVARAIYGCNLPFSLVTANAFQRLLHFLAPGTVAPTPKQLATTLLDQEYADLQGLNFF